MALKKLYFAACVLAATLIPNLPLRADLPLDNPPEGGEIFSRERRPPLIEAIEIIGNAETQRAVVLGRLLIAVGDPVDELLIEQSRLRLYATGFFKSVEFSLKRGSRRGRVVLAVELEERNTLTIDGLYLGASKIAPFYAGLGLLESNFLGRGVAAGVGFVHGNGRTAIDSHIFVPELSGTPLQLSASAIYVAAAETQLTYSRIGATLGVGARVGTVQRVSLDYRIETIHAEPLPNLDPLLLRGAPSILSDDSILSSLSLVYEWDTRDDAFIPSQGARIALAVETGTVLLGSSYEFTKYTGEAQVATTVADDHRLRLFAFGGLIQGRAPFFTQFFLSDHAYFVLGQNALPRALQINFSASNDYDDLIISTGADYSIPLQQGGDWLVRSYIYGGIALSATASLDELQEDPSGRGVGGHFPFSFDAGIRFDTWIGNFTLSVAYILKLVL